MQTYGIVVGFGGSDGGLRALSWAVAEAAKRGGTVQAVTGPGAARTSRHTRHWSCCPPPQVVLRVGYGPAVSGSPRRPLSDVVSPGEVVSPG
jgi:hypothetical protein